MSQIGLLTVTYGYTTYCPPFSGNVPPSESLPLPEIDMLNAAWRVNSAVRCYSLAYSTILSHKLICRRLTLRNWLTRRGHL